MHASALDQPSDRRRAVLVATVLASVLLHGVAVWASTRIKVKERTVIEWVQLAVQMEEPQPEQVVEPPPEPEPEPAPPKERAPREVAAKDLPDRPEPAPAEPPPDEPVRRLVQGLDNDSFLEGSGGFGAKRGNTTSTRASDDTLDGDEGFSLVPYAAVGSAPAIRRKPLLPTPDEVRATRIEGVVEALLTIDADGSVREVEVLRGLHPAADAACVAALSRSSWTPGTRDGQPVVVTGVPYSCRFEMQR